MIYKVSSSGGDRFNNYQAGHCWSKRNKKRSLLTYVRYARTWKNKVTIISEHMFTTFKRIVNQCNCMYKKHTKLFDGDKNWR